MSVLALLQDPRNIGGVGTVCHWYRQWMDVHRPGERTERFLDDKSRGFILARAREDGEEAIPRLLPILHVPQYYAGRRLIQPVASNVGETHVIGGVALHGVLGRRETPCLLWIGTTIGDERRKTSRHHLLHRRTLHAVTLPWLERMERSVLLRARRVLAQSPYTANLVMKLGVRATTVEVVPVPVDTDVFAPDDSRREGILFVGRVRDPRKNFAGALRVFRESGLVRDHGLDVVATDCPTPVSQARDHAQIRWWGEVDDVAERYRHAEVFILTSYQEGLGIVVLEAMSSGTPVVALRCGGPDRLIEESGGGLVAESLDELRQAVEVLLNDQSAAREIGSRGREWALRNVAAEKFLAERDLFRV